MIYCDINETCLIRNKNRICRHFEFCPPTRVAQAGLRGTLFFPEPYGLKICFFEKNCFPIFFPFNHRYECNAPGLLVIILVVFRIES